MIRYLSGLLVCGLGLFGGGWLIVVVVLLRGTPTIASLASLGTGAGVALVSAVGIACWSVAWRQRMRLDGVLASRPRPVAGGTHGATAGRSRRALRRDMRHVARAARRTSRRDEAARRQGAAPRDEAAWPDEVMRRDEAACRDGMVRRRAAAPVGRPQGDDRHPVIPGPRIPLAAEAGNGGSRGKGEPERPAVVLTELRALLEPLLTTGPMPVLDSDTDDSAALDLLGEEESW
jgi:hypothetical protein